MALSTRSDLAKIPSLPYTPRTSIVHPHTHPRCQQAGKSKRTRKPRSASLSGEFGCARMNATEKPQQR
jgi:hypothetical protein